MAEPAQLPADLAGLGVRDEVLELVDLVVEAVDHVEEALGDLVDQVVDEHAHLFVLAARLFRRSRVEWLLARRRLRDRDELIRRHHEVDLLVVQTILARRPRRGAGGCRGRRCHASRCAAAARRRGREERAAPRAQSARCRPAASLAAPPRSDRRGRSSAGGRARPEATPRSGRDAVYRFAVSAVPGCPSYVARNRSASRAAIQPEPAAVTAWR